MFSLGASFLPRVWRDALDSCIRAGQEGPRRRRRPHSRRPCSDRHAPSAVVPTTGRRGGGFLRRRTRRRCRPCGGRETGSWAGAAAGWWRRLQAAWRQGGVDLAVWLATEISAARTTQEATFTTCVHCEQRLGPESIRVDGRRSPRNTSSCKGTCAVDSSAWSDEDLERIRRSTVMLTPGLAHGVDRVMLPARQDGHRGNAHRYGGPKHGA